MKSGAFGLSSASLRNAMADLEDLGFLTHPHVSAGRIPTDRGYRAFVEVLMPSQVPSDLELSSIAAELEPESFEVERFLSATSRILSRLTGEVGVVALPSSPFVLQAVHFTRVAERRILFLRVVEPGLVESRLIETQDDFSERELEEISRRLTVDYAGLSLSEIRGQLVRALEEEKVRMDAAVARAEALARQAFSTELVADSTIFLEGTEHILEKPEFRSDVEALRRMFRAFEERVRLINLLSDCLSRGRPTNVVIGSESPLTDETHSAVVAAAFRQGSRTLGALGVIGPRRMEYARVIPLVEELGRYVSRRLTEGVS